MVSRIDYFCAKKPKYYRLLIVLIKRIHNFFIKISSKNLVKIQIPVILVKILVFLVKIRPLTCLQCAKKSQKISCPYSNLLKVFANCEPLHLFLETKCTTFHHKSNFLTKVIIKGLITHLLATFLNQLLLEIKYILTYVTHCLHLVLNTQETSHFY